MSPVLQAFLPSFRLHYVFIPLTGLVQCCSDCGRLNRNADDDAHELQPITIVLKGQGILGQLSSNDKCEG
jgi:hypothetical protein